MFHSNSFVMVSETFPMWTSPWKERAPLTVDCSVRWSRGTCDRRFRKSPWHSRAMLAWLFFGRLSALRERALPQQFILSVLDRSRNPFHCLVFWQPSHTVSMSWHLGGLASQRPTMSAAGCEGQGVISRWGVRSLLVRLKKSKSCGMGYGRDVSTWLEIKYRAGGVVFLLSCHSGLRPWGRVCKKENGNNTWKDERNAAGITRIPLPASKDNLVRMEKAAQAGLSLSFRMC